MKAIDRPVIEVRAVFGTGEQESRFWRIDDNPPKPAPQPWMREPRKTWVHPQDPIVFSFLVDFEHEDTAREWLESLGGSRS